MIESFARVSSGQACRGRSVVAGDRGALERLKHDAELSVLRLRCLAVRYREEQPTFIPPMLLTSGAVPDGEAWALELKWDGCRAQLRYDGRSVSLRTRHGRECSADFPELQEIGSVLGKRRVTLDGELVCLDSDGRPDFARLRRRLTGSTSRPASGDAPGLRPAPPRRTTRLDRCPMTSGARCSRSSRSTGPPGEPRRAWWSNAAQDFVARVAELGLEGVVAKRLSSTYLPGRRCTAWVKHKLRREERLAVTGIRRRQRWTLEAIFVARHQPDGSFTGAGAIELGLHRGLVEQLEHRLAELPVRRRGAVTWYSAEVSVVASLHGPPDKPVRDAILREVIDA